jgi:hypothetical protein
MDPNCIRIHLGQQIRIRFGNPDPGEPKLSPKKGRKIMFEELDRSLLGFKKTLMTTFDQQIF